MAAENAGGAIDESHPLIAELLVNVERGAHSVLWATLRRSVFPGEGGWARLKAWCSGRALECELSYGNSPRSTEVVFRKSLPLARA